MDVGGFRDMHRHRRCTQIEQGFTRQHGYDTPPDIATAGLEPRYKPAMQKVVAGLRKVGAALRKRLYLLPMAYRKRTLFKMDFAEALVHFRAAQRRGGAFFLPQCGLCHV